VLDRKLQTCGVGSWVKQS